MSFAEQSFSAGAPRPAPTRSLVRRGGEIRGGKIRASYDLARTTDGNRKHWAAADALSAEAVNSLGIRTILRNRTRYEVRNSSYVKGMIGTLQNDTIGIGPRLQMLIKGKNKSIIEADWDTWSRKAKLGKKLRQLRRARAETGEAFLVTFTNPKIPTPVKLDVMVVESDRVTDVGGEYSTDPLWCDGIQYDEWQNPISYRILKYHPGGPNGFFYGVGASAYTDYPAERVFHYFKDDERPGQRRGVPELQPSIQTGAELRRFDNARLRTAEVHARVSLALESTVAPELEDGDEPEAPVAMDTVELPDSGAIVLPPGMKLSGMTPTQPGAGSGDFVDQKIRETARCIQMPFAIAAMDSSKANMSARYMDSQIYASAVRVDRSDLEIECLDWLFEIWVAEYWLVKANMPRTVEAYPHTYFWPSLNQHADPSKVASARETNINLGTQSTVDAVALDGDDLEDIWTKEAEALGVTYEQFQKLQRLKRFGTTDPNGEPMKSAEPLAPAGSANPATPAGAPRNGARQPVGSRNGNGRVPPEDSGDAADGEN